MGDSSKEAIEHDFPRLSQEGYAIASPADPKYNCIAFAAGDYSRWWEKPYGSPNHYWPPGVNADETINDWIAAFRMLNYEITENSTPDRGFDKVAIYGTETGDATHVAIQRDGQEWMSLGRGNDIAHRTPESLESECYGKVLVFMRRKAYGAAG